jgi:hypothetical protein
MVWKIACGVVLGLVLYEASSRLWALYELRQLQSQMAADFARFDRDAKVAAAQVQRQSVGHVNAQLEQRVVAVSKPLGAHEYCYQGYLCREVGFGSQASTQPVVELGRPVSCTLASATHYQVSVVGAPKQ